MSLKFTRHILGMEVSPAVLKRFEATPDEIAAAAWDQRTWIDLVLHQVIGDESLEQGAATSAFEFHKCVSDRASSHLALTSANIMRTSWLAAEILSRDPQKAQSAALKLVRDLAGTPPAMRTPFEQYVFEETSLWNNLVDFAHAKPPVRVWQGRGHPAPLPIIHFTYPWA